MFWSRRREHAGEEDLSSYLDGELRPDRARAMSAHVDACADCRALLDGLRAAKALVAELPRVESSRSFTLSRAMAASRPAPTRPPLLNFAPALALSVLVVLLAVDFIGVNGDGSSTGGPALEQASKVAEQASQPSAAQDTGAPSRSLAPPATPATSFAQPPSAPTSAAPLENADRSSAAGQAERTTEAPRETSASDDGDVWVHRLEALAAVAFALSLLIVYGPRVRDRLRRREGRL